MKSRQFPLRCKCEILNFVIELVNYKKSPDSNPVFSLLTRMAKEHYHLFLWRTGIKAYSTLMGSLQSHSSVSIILSTFHEILQRSNVFSGLKPQLSTIQTILSVDICIAARQSCEDFFRGLSNHLNCLDQSTGCATAVNPFSLRVDYARTVVMILNLWGTKHTEADWSYLSHAGVLPDLHKLFVKLYTSLTIKLPYKTHAFGLGSQVRARLDESNSILCDRSHLKTCLCATWALIRHFGASIGSANVSAGNTDLSCTDVPEQFLSVIYDLARRSLVRLNSDETRFTDYRSDQSGLEAQAGFHFDANQGRRCHELISAPMRFMNMEPGVVLSPGEVLSYPCGPDFSITCWLLLTQDSTGYYRSLFFRGLSRDSWPIVLLRDLDLRLEVGYLDENSGAFCKLITSKDACPLNAWIHIGLVCEGSKLRLYLDGSLDAQQINCEARPSTRHPLYVGRVPDGGFPIHGVRGGIEGSLANLRFYTRALSPIHVRVLCDQGAPEEFCFHDRKRTTCRRGETMARARSPPRFFCFICVLLGLSVWCVLALVVLDRKSRATGLVVGPSKSAQVRATLARANARYIHTVRDALDAALDLFDDERHDDAAPDADADAARQVRATLDREQAAFAHGLRDALDAAFDLFDDDAHDDAAPGADAAAAREMRDWVEDREAAVVHGVRGALNGAFDLFDDDPAGRAGPVDERPDDEAAAG